MTLSLAYWLYEKIDDRRKTHTKSGSFGHVVWTAAYVPIAVGLAGMPYDHIIRGAQRLRDIDYWSDMASMNRYSEQYMRKHRMPISRSSKKLFASTAGEFMPGTARYAGDAGARILRGRSARLAAKMGARLVPGLGWALLAYDVYTVTNMILDD